MCDEMTRLSEGRVTCGAANAPHVYDNSIIIDAAEYDRNSSEKAIALHDDDSRSNSTMNEKEINTIIQISLFNKEQVTNKFETTLQTVPNEMETELHELPSLQTAQVGEESLFQNEEIEVKQEGAESGMMLLYIPTSFVNAAGQTVCIRRRCLVNPESEYGQFMIGSSELLNTHFASVAMMNAEQIRDRVRHEKHEKEQKSFESNAAATTSPLEDDNTDSIVINTEALAHCEEERIANDMCGNTSETEIKKYTNGKNNSKEHTHWENNALIQVKESTTFTYMRYLPCWRRKRPRCINDLDRNNYSNSKNNSGDEDQINYSESERSTSCPERASTVKEVEVKNEPLMKK